MPGKRPEPRKSSLSSAHPYTPPETAQDGDLAPAPRTPPAAQPVLSAPVDAATTTKPPVASKGADKKPLSVRATLHDQARIRAAFMATNSAERHGSLSDFITRAALEKVAQLEQQYNDGSPWPAVDAGDVPTGRPIG